MAAVLKHESQVAGDMARAPSVIDALDEGDDIPIRIGGNQIDGVAMNQFGIAGFDL